MCKNVDWFIIASIIIIWSQVLSRSEMVIKDSNVDDGITCGVRDRPWN